VADDIYTKMAQSVIEGEMELVAELAQHGLDASGSGRKALGTAVAGTVAGDIHEIGADGYAEDEIEAVAAAEQLVGAARASV